MDLGWRKPSPNEKRREGLNDRELEQGAEVHGLATHFFPGFQKCLCLSPFPHTLLSSFKLFSEASFFLFFSFLLVTHPNTIPFFTTLRTEFFFHLALMIVWKLGIFASFFAFFSLSIYRRRTFRIDAFFLLEFFFSRFWFSATKRVSFPWHNYNCFFAIDSLITFLR